MKAAAVNTIICNLRLATAATAQTPSWLPPPDSARCPSKSGAGDRRGAGDHMKPQTVSNAVATSRWWSIACIFSKISSSINSPQKTPLNSPS